MPVLLQENSSTSTVVLEFSHGGTGASLWGMSRHLQPLLRYSRGERPFMRRKNLLSEEVSAKWRRSAICWMLRLDVRSRKDASIMSIWLTQLMMVRPSLRYNLISLYRYNEQVRKGYIMLRPSSPFLFYFIISWAFLLLFSFYFAIFAGRNDENG